VITYRTFRNGDPPAIRELWNLQAGPSRGCGWLAGCDHLEQLIFSKPYFNRDCFQLAFSGKQLVGLCLAGFGGDERREGIDASSGAICLLLVHPEFRRQGIGAELLRRGQDFLRQGGAATQFVGAQHPLNPFGLGLYGGSDTPGVLESDAEVERFVRKRGYEPADTSLVYQLSLLDEIARLDDPRLPLLRRNVKIFSETFPLPKTWWHACTMGPTISYRYEMVDGQTDEQIASALVWEMETFGWAWKVRTFGITDFNVEFSRRRRGYGKLLLQSILKHLQENKIGLVEAQMMERNLPTRSLFELLGFQRVDIGRVYRLQKTQFGAAASK
jgi:ribosomal protein S18 acetylase RimI-like enzyme